MNNNTIYLRGGGCGTSKKDPKQHKQEMERGKQKVDMTEKEKMAKLIQQHSEIISKNAIIAMSEKKKLMSSFQFFLDNRQELWGIIVDKEESAQIIDIILNNLKPLLEALRTLIKGFVAYSVYLSQIIQLLSWIIFCFYSNSKENKERFMKVNDQTQYLEIINQIKKEIEIEKNIDKYQNNLEYELYIIESIFTIVPTDSDEAKEIAASFLIGAATSFLSFSINDEFLTSLKKGVIYIYNEHDKSSRKKILKIIFALLQLKYETINKIQKSDQAKNCVDLDQLNNVYNDVISKSSDWQVWCTWTKVLSQLFQQKLILPLDKIQSLKISNEPYIHKNEIRKTCWLNIDSRLIENNATAKLIYQNIEELQELGRLQYTILYGYKQMPSFESLYSSKLTQAIEKENFDAFQFNLSSVSIMLHNSQEIQKAQEQLQQHIELLSTTNKSKIQDIENYLKKAINNTIQLLESINSLHEIEHPNDNELESPKQPVGQNAIFQSQLIQNQSPIQQIEDKEEKWLEEIVKLKKSLSIKFVSFFLKSLLIKIKNQSKENQQKEIDDKTKEEYQIDFILGEKKQDKEQINQNNQVQDQIIQNNNQDQIIQNNNQVQNQIIQNNNFDQDQIIQNYNQDQYKLNVLDLLQEIEKKKVEKKKTKTPKYKEIVLIFKKDPFKIENLQQLQSRLKYISIKRSKHQMKNDEEYKFGFKEGIKLLQGGSAFLRWNLKLFVKMKFYIQELSQNQYNDKQLNQQANQIIDSLKGFSLQLASLKALQKCIKFFYSKYDACIKYKLIRKVSQKRNVIYQVLKTITLKKFETLNMVYAIHKETIRKVKETGVIYICQSIFQAIQNEHEKFLDDIVQLKRAIQMIIELLNADEKKNNKDQDEFKIFTNQEIFNQVKIVNPVNNVQWLQNKDFYFKLTLFYQNYCHSFQSWQKKNKNYSQNVVQQIQMKQQLIKEYLEKIEIAQEYKTLQEEDDQFKQELYNEVQSHLESLLKSTIQSEQENFKAEQISPKENLHFFQFLFDNIKEIEHQVQVQFDNLKFINQQQGVFSTLINNSLLLKRANSQYQIKIEQNEKKIKDLVGNYEEKLPQQVIELKDLQQRFYDQKLILSPNLKSEIFFILTQIWKKEDVTSDPSYYDKFAEAASDLINKNKWRVRQSCIYELMYFKNSCLTQATVDLAKGLLVKCRIYETDRRNKQLLDDQDENQVVSMFQQCWTQQEEDVQTKIKQKLEELNDIAYKITIETKQYEKSKFKKRYVELESEIQGIVKNAESLGNSLGTSLLFFQDIKNDLVNIQSQLKNLQGSIDQIHKDIQLLQGRSIKDLLIIRMQRVLQQRIILNSENVYVPIKTKEKQVLENQEDEETPLYTDDLFSNGEINEFIWKQQKLSLLIHGQAGSGKSTAARKIEEFLWLLFKKNINIAESIPIIPIFVSLPQLKDPLSMAIEETLKSDNYRFNDKQIIEFKEAVEQNQFKLVIIMDSYDEIKSEFTNRNLILSNKLYKWRCQSDEQRFPKIITTSRSEIFINNEYRSWFLPESENLQYYKEIRLLNFTNEQVNTYIEYHTILSVKKIIKDFYFNNKDNSGFFAFEEIFNEIIKVINEKEQEDDKQDQQFLLSKNQIRRILSLCESFVSGDIAMTMQQSLEEVWYKEYYIKNIRQMDIGSLLETPFMIEIVASVLPQMIKHRQELNTLKESFMKKLSQQENFSNEQLSKEWSKIISNEQFLDEYLKVSNDSDRDSLISKHFKKLDNFQILQNAMKLDPLCSYDFYDQFFAQYFKRQINKLIESGESLAYISNLSDLWEFTHRLANDMTLQQVSQVQYIPRILLFQKKKDVDWRDIYFNDEQEQGQIKKLFRKIMPIKQKYGIYSFNHKSLQEFLVAKWLIQQLDQFNQSLNSNGIDNQLDDLCVHNLSKDSMNGVLKFMVDKLNQNQFLQKKLFEITILSKNIQKNDQNKIQGSMKVSQTIQLKRAQTQLLAQQNFTQNLYTDEEVTQRIIQASSNCLYLLHLLKYPLNKDLSYIKINDIQLLDSNFVGANLLKSEFSNVNISQSNFNFANLQDVVWNDILIDELPSIETKLNLPQQSFYFNYIKSEDLLIFNTKDKIVSFNYKTQTEAVRKNESEYNISNVKYILVSQNQSNQKIAYFHNDSITLISTINSKIKLPDGFIFQTAYFTQKDDLIIGLIIGSEKLLIRLATDVQQEEIVINDNNNIYLNQLVLKKIIQIASYENDIIFLSDRDVIFIKEIDNKYIYFQFQIKCSHKKCKNQQIDENNENQYECQLLQKYTCIEVSENQNLLLFGYLEEDDYKSSGILVIEKQYLTQQPQDKNQEQKQYITTDKFIQLDIPGEDQLKAYFVDEDKYILSFSYSNNLTYMKLWNYKEKKIISSTILDGQIKQMTKISGLLISTINNNGKIQIWDLQALLQQQNSNPKSTITCCIFSTDRNIISGNQHGIIQIWDRQKGTKIGKDLESHTAAVSSLVISQKENEILISGDTQGNINFWNLLKYELFKSLYIISPIKSLNMIEIEKNYQLITHSQNYHYIQLWDKEFKSYQLFCENQNNIKINQIELQSIIQFLQNKSTRSSPKKYADSTKLKDCQAFAIGKYTNNFYFAQSLLDENQQQTKDILINIYYEEFKEQKSQDETKEQLFFSRSVILEFEKNNTETEIVQIIKEINQKKILVTTNTKIFIIKISKLGIEKKRFDYPNIGKILDVQIDEDLLFCCGNSVIIKNIRSGKDIPSSIKTINQNEQQIEMIGEQDFFCSLLYYRKKNTLFIGMTSGKIIEYDLLQCNSQVHYQHKKQIIYLQIHTRQDGLQDVLVTAGKDSLIYFWPLTIQDLKQLKPTDQKQILLEDSEINKFWYFDQENYFICQNQSGYYLAAYFPDGLSYYKISDYDPTSICDYNNKKQAFYQLTFKKNSSHDSSKKAELTKTMVLQEAIKAHYQENNNYKAEFVLLDHNKSQIITADDDGNILFWSPNGDHTDKIKPFDTDQALQVQISISQKFNSIICGCFDGNSKKYLIAKISLEDQKKQDIIIAFGEDKPTLKQLQILSQDLILILTGGSTNNINIYSIKAEQFIQQMKNLSIGSAVLTEYGQNKESVFLTYGEFNQLTYYEKINEKYGSRFRFGNAIKKFSCHYANITNSKFLSKHQIDLTKIFNQGDSV
ncbi:unnamed protein product [Paramecium primaurelia]|uniref:NACHT domain-containing protein n=1 Tax=Paramecium primaurelia TaxID=5886 RepID=A0A8S1PBT9_PARPR|nr:unnamed protein product [Paramecium primaurelia]